MVVVVEVTTKQEAASQVLQMYSVRHDIAVLPLRQAMEAQTTIREVTWRNLRLISLAILRLPVQILMAR